MMIDCVNVCLNQEFQMSTCTSFVYYKQVNRRDTPVYDDQVQMLQVPAGTKSRRASADFSQDQMALVIDLLRNIIPGHHDSSPVHTHTRSSLSPGNTELPSEIESLYDDIVTTPQSEESSLYENIDDNRVTTFHEDKSRPQAKPTLPPRPGTMKRKKVPNKPSSSRFGIDLRPTGRTVTPSEEDRRQTISELLHCIV